MPRVVAGAIGERSRGRQGRLRAALGVTLVVLGWSIVAGLGLLALFRWIAWDWREPLIVLDDLTLIVYLPAWVVAAGARRWWLASATALAVMAQLSFVAPELLAATPVPTWTRHAPSITVLDANIDKSLQFEVGYRDAIKRYRPDVVAMEEFTPLALQGMMRSGALRGFPYRCAAPASGDDRRRGRPRSRSGNDLAQWSNRAGFRPDRSRIDWSPSCRHLDRF